MLDTWRRSGLRGLLPLVGPRAGWWTRISRRVRLANVGSLPASARCSWPCSRRGCSGPSAAARVRAWSCCWRLPSRAWPSSRGCILPRGRNLRLRHVDGATSAEMERQQLLRAVNNMPIGLVMFDANKRALIVNDCYREMYGLSQAVTARGSHLREMLEERLASGSQEGVDRETYIARILKLVEQTESSTRLVPLGDGRTVNIIHHPIPGGGWIGTHEDVTEREKLHSQLCPAERAAQGARAAAEGAEPAVRRRAQEHVARPVHVQPRAAPAGVQQPVRRAVRPAARADAARDHVADHRGAQGCRGSPLGRKLCPGRVRDHGRQCTGDQDHRAAATAAPS